MKSKKEIKQANSNPFLDKLWRLNNLYWIQNKEGDRVLFTLNDVQNDLYELEKKYDRIVTGKSRKHGVSTYKAIYNFDETLFNPGSHNFLVSYDHKSAKDIFGKVLFAKDNLPPELLSSIEFGEETAASLEVIHRVDGGVQKSIIEVGTTSRGKTPSSVHISELTRMEEMQKGKALETLEGTVGSVPFGGKISIESTFGVKGDQFDQLFFRGWDMRSAGEEFVSTDYYPVFYNWQWDKEEIAKAPHHSSLPQEMIDYQEKHNLSVSEIDFYYTKLRELNMSRSSMFRNYPTTVGEARQVFTQGAVFENEIDLWYNEGHIVNAPYDSMYPLFVFEDIGLNDTTALIFMQSIGKEIIIVEFYQNSNLPVDHYIDYIRNSGYRCDRVFLPHDAVQRSYLDKKNVRDYYSKAGMRYEVMPKSGEGDRIEEVRRHAPSIVFNKKKAGHLPEILGQVKRRNEGDKKVVHDKSSDALDVTGYMLQNLHRLDQEFDTGFHVIE